MPQTRRTKAAKESSTRERIALLKKARLYRGLYARVAEQCECHISTVGRVARQERVAPRIADAIVAEVQRIEREAAA